MRRSILVLLVVAMMAGIIAVPAMAAEPRATTAIAGLDITGTTATCSLRASADNSTDTLKAIIRLYRDGTCIATWSGSGSGSLYMTRTKTVTTGHTYKMTVDLTVNDADYPVADVYKTI